MGDAEHRGHSSREQKTRVCRVCCDDVSCSFVIPTVAETRNAYPFQAAQSRGMRARG